ncbi:hypothetical protein [Haloactinopolyspora sp.]|uniref:hypothetical protein n=1 Tax=Haloactinopolyspora sp. TaxID=1966353 RepID=UPI0026301D8D|nr:hypothetical protein [Haloactinopolyspora sp.]
MTTESRAEGALGPTLPSWALRAGIGVAGFGTAAAACAWASASVFVLILLAGLAVAAAGLPASHWPSVLLAVCAVVVLAGADGITGWTAGTMFGMHATHVLAAVGAVVPVDASVERAALRPSLERFVRVQMGAQLLVLFAWLLTRG